MMKLKLLKNLTVANLNSNICNNIDLYRSGNFDHIFSDTSLYFEIDTEIDESIFDEFKGDNANKSEVENCKLMLAALGMISPYLARDERLWACLTHSNLLSYTRSRWPIPSDDEKAVAHIATHFFAKGKRGIERDNAASRLWWQALLCKRVTTLSLDDALNCLLHDSDVRASIIERPSTSQCLNVFSAILVKLHESYISDKSLYNRQFFRELMKKINLFGGIKLLNALDEDAIMKFLDKEIANSF